MAEAVYILCFLTSVLVTALLLRKYQHRRVRLLLWCALGFAGLTLNNLLLIVDVMIVPQVDLGIFRAFAAFIGFSLLAFGLIWESAGQGGERDG
jgi:hypothetical protein